MDTQVRKHTHLLDLRPILCHLVLVSHGVLARKDGDYGKESKFPGWRRRRRHQVRIAARCRGDGKWLCVELSG